MTCELPLLPLIVDDVPAGLTQALAQEGVPFLRRNLEGSEGRFVLFDSRRGLSQPPGYGQVAIDIDPWRQVSEDDPFEALIDERVETHRWDMAGLTLTEEIGVVDRYAVRRRLLDHLRSEIEQAGGIWLCVAAFPFPYHSVFNFRIDHPQFEASDFAAMLQTVGNHGQAVTHFIAGAALESQGHDALVRLQESEIGALGYQQAIFPAEEENLRNAQQGIDALRAAGIETSGFAMPAGDVDRELLAVLDQMDIRYGSQSSLAYDDRPFLLQGRHVLQIPEHPLTLASFLRAVETEDSVAPSAVQRAMHTAIDHFRQTARSKYHAGEPVFFYGPSGVLGHYPQVLQAVFDTIDCFGAIWKTTLADFSNWWRARGAVRLTVTREDDHYVVLSDHHPREYNAGIEYWRGHRVARMRLKGQMLRFSPMALAYENRVAQFRVSPVRVEPPAGFRERLLRWIGGRPPAAPVSDRRKAG